MPVINLITKIKADRNIVFDLSRSIELHKISTEETNEEAIAGVTSGLIGQGEFVTWRAKHFGFYHELTSRITICQKPEIFADEMEKGIFKRFQHVHTFEEKDGETIMTDVFDYDSPLGILGKIADKLFLEKYMTYFLEKRNQTIKDFAESDRWKELLN